MVSEIIRQLKTVPEYFLALKGALAVLASGLPIYAGIRYFMYKRRLSVPFHFHIAFMSTFILFAGLAFLFASPLAGYLHPALISGYLVLTCLFGSYGITMLIDVFLVQHYLSGVRRFYISPPLRTIFRLSIFILLIFPALHFVLHFNPLAAIAIPTIATAGLALALQDTLKSFIAGVGLGNMIRLGEWISFQGKEGRVIDINWARTTLETVDGQRVYIPNNMLLSGIFLNYSTGNPATQQSFKVSASYDASPAHVKETLAKCAHDVPGVAHHPLPQAVLLEYSDSGILYALYYWLDDYTQKQPVQDDVATRIWYAFRREGIEIPYPIRTLHIARASNAAQKSKERVERMLQEWTLAEAFYAEELRELSLCTVSRSYASGETIVKQGELGQSLFVIVEGTVGIYKEDRPQTPVATLKERDIFGEMSLLTGEPRSATVRAQGPTEVLEIEKMGLQKVIARRPELSERLAELVSKRQEVLMPHPASEKPGQAASSADRPLAKRIRQFFGLA